jgi:hypothetical protein
MQMEVDSSFGSSSGGKKNLQDHKRLKRIKAISQVSIETQIAQNPAQ